MVNNASQISQLLDLESRYSRLQQKRGQKSQDDSSRPDAFQHLFDTIRKPAASALSAPASKTSKSQKSRSKSADDSHPDPSPADEGANAGPTVASATDDHTDADDAIATHDAGDSTTDAQDASTSADAATNVAATRAPAAQNDCDQAPDGEGLTVEDQPFRKLPVNNEFAKIQGRFKGDKAPENANPAEKVTPDAEVPAAQTAAEQNTEPVAAATADAKTPDKQVRAAPTKTQAKALQKAPQEPAELSQGMPDFSRQLAEATQQTMMSDTVSRDASKAAIPVDGAGKEGGGGTNPVLTNITMEQPKNDTATKAEVAQAAQESPRAEGQETFDQVVLGLKGKLDPKNGKAEIRLEPPNLGTVKVSLSLADGQLTAQFQSASDVVRDLLKGNLDKLKSTLQGQGVAVDQLAVSAPQDASGSGQNAQSSFGSATHDGRSAGQYQQDGQSGRQRSDEGFARMFNQVQEAPLDLVA